MKINFLKLIPAIIVGALSIAISYAQTTLPPGFSEVLVAGGITQPTTMSVAPDGRFFVAQQNGLLRVVKNGALLSQPFVTLSVNTNGERGLLGIAFDPAFSTNQYVYVCYTIANGSFNRVSRFTANGDIAVPGSEVVIIDLDSLIANYHGGGHLGFGPDGKLYIAAGENGRSLKAQDLDSYLGKILRVNPNGSVPSDNPFPGPGKRQRVWSYGMRNPFTFSFQPGTGRLFLNDVGEVTYEEINDATVGGGNFGWPAAEGMSLDTAFENPVFYYQHGVGPDSGCAITGGTFLNSGVSNYPTAYTDKYYYIDYCGNWINSITTTGSPIWSNFATEIANYSVGMVAGPDGNLYYLSRNNEALYKITYTPSPIPVVVNAPASQTISEGFPVTFSVTASGTPPLSYQWRFNNVNISGATNVSYTIPAVALSDSGNYTVIVSNSFGSDTSAIARLTVTTNQPPQAVITSPLANTLYTAGDVISFQGSASDPESGSLPASTFEWVVVFHHDVHVHPGPTAGSGISSGTFTIPDVGETAANVFYRLYLIVTDPDGAVDSAYVDILPRTSLYTFETQPSGLTLTLDGQPFISPDTVTSVEGMIRTISASSSQMIGQTQYLFTGWNNGGTQTQTFSTPVNDTLLIAYYDSVDLAYNLGTDTVACINQAFILDAGANYSSYAWSDGSVNQFLSIQSLFADTIYVGVTVTNSNGETGNDSITVYIQNCNSIENLNSNLFYIYPVPSDGGITISPSQENYFLQVTDITGRIIINKESVFAHNEKHIHLSPGLYSLILFSNDHHVIYHKPLMIIN